MKTALAVLLIASAVLAVCLAEDPCACDPVAGCKAIGCPCFDGNDQYEPPTYPPQAARPASCGECPPQRPCPSSLVRIACSEPQQCDAEELKTLVKVVPQ